MSNKTILGQYNRVRIVEFLKPLKEFDSGAGINKREPRVGDVATILEVYDDPPGYELECCAAVDGVTTWLHAFAADEVKLELLPL